MKLKLIALTAALALGSVLLGSCAAPAGGITLFRRSDSSRSDGYAGGGASIRDNVKNIEVDWDAGKVEIVGYDGDTIEFSETANRTLDEDSMLRYTVEGNTLRIRFTQKEKYFWNNLQKTLTLKLPRSLTLDTLEVDTAAAEVEASALRAREVEIDAASGAVRVEAEELSESLHVDTASGSVTAKLAGTRKIDLETSSGSVELTAAGAADEVEIETTSGAVNAELDTVRELEIQTVSGAATAAAASAEKAKVETVSGKAELTLGAMPSECGIETVSGAVKLTLPKGASFSAKVETVSGSLTSDFAMTISDGKTYTSGTGRASVKIETLSGDIALRAAAR